LRNLLRGRMHDKAVDTEGCRWPFFERTADWLDLPSGDLGPRDLEEAGFATREVRLCSVGGGLGSFALVDLLRIRGMASKEITVIGPEPRPWASFKELLLRSGANEEDRLRSDSATRIDNPWGFPSYAMEEALRSKRPWPVIAAIGEPFLGEPYAPKGSQVFEGIDRECTRIQWSEMLSLGLASGVRRRQGGGWWVLQRGLWGNQDLAIGCQILHLALGHATPDQDGSCGMTNAFGRVVNVYGTPHWRALVRTPSRCNTVVVVGRGMTAMQVIQYAIHAPGHSNHVIHLVRNEEDDATSDFPNVRGVSEQGLARREGISGREGIRPDHDTLGRLCNDRVHGPVRWGPWRLRPYAAARNAFGGTLHTQLLHAGSQERPVLQDWLRRASSPAKKAWLASLEHARKAGRYEVLYGGLDSLEPSAGAVRVIARGQDGTLRTRKADLVMLCTGLAPPWEAMELFGQSESCRCDSGLPPLDEHFSVSGESLTMREEDRYISTGTLDGQILRDFPVYISGPLAARGPAGPVDSFWGLLWAAWCIGEDLTRRGLLPAFGPLRSIRAWWRWLHGCEP